MREYEELYTKISEAQELNQIKYDKNYSVSEVINLFNDKTNARKKLSQEIKILLNTYVYKYLNNYRSITNEVYNELYMFATKIYSHTIHMDCVLAYQIHKALYKKALLDKNLNKIIKEIYHSSLAIYYADSFIFKNEGKKGFSRVKQYFKEYDYLDRESKDYLNRSAGNYIMSSITIDGQGIEKTIDEGYKLIAFWEKKKSTDTDNLPYDNYIFATYRNLTIPLQFVRSGKMCTPKVLECLVKSSTYVYEHIDLIYKITTLPIVYTCRYAYYACLWHAGKISGEELLVNLKALCGENPDDPYSSESLWKSLRMRSYYILYTEYVKGKESKECQQEVNKTIEEIKKYLQGYEVSKLHTIIDYEILSCINSLYARDKNLLDIDRLSYFSVIIDQKAFYYNTMNYEISLLVLNYLYQIKSTLISNFEYNDIKTFLYVCCHSANCGMQYYTRDFYRFYRKRFSEDIKLINYHVERGQSLLLSNMMSQDCLDVCYNHHNKYEKRINCNKKVNLIIDLICFSELINQNTDKYSFVLNNPTFKNAFQKVKKNKDLINKELLKTIDNSEGLKDILCYKTEVARNKVLYDTFKTFFEERDAMLKTSILTKEKDE